MQVCVSPAFMFDLASRDQLIRLERHSPSWYCAEELQVYFIDIFIAITQTNTALLRVAPWAEETLASRKKL